MTEYQEHAMDGVLFALSHWAKRLRKEMGKYVSAKDVAQLDRYVTIAQP